MDGCCYTIRSHAAHSGTFETIIGNMVGVTGQTTMTALSEESQDAVNDVAATLEVCTHSCHMPKLPNKHHTQANCLNAH